MKVPGHELRAVEDGQEVFFWWEDRFLLGVVYMAQGRHARVSHDTFGIRWFEVHELRKVEEDPSHRAAVLQMVKGGAS